MSDPSAPTRRELLQASAAVTGASVVGVAAFSGIVSAHGCPRTPGFWANHDWCEVPVSDDPSLGSIAESLGLDCENIDTDTYSLAGEARTMAEWQNLLIGPIRGDKAQIMAKHLLATNLNFQMRGRTDLDCVDEEIEVDGLGTTTVRDARSAAAAWLWASNWPDEQRDWVVEVDSEDVDGEVLKDVLDDFNNDRLGLDCDCPPEEWNDGGGGGGNGGGNGPPESAGQRSGDDGPPENRGNGNGNGNGRGPP